MKPIGADIAKIWNHEWDMSPEARRARQRSGYFLAVEDFSGDPLDEKGVSGHDLFGFGPEAAHSRNGAPEAVLAIVLR